jgi:ABC-type phosphate/phosphonate transport system substrate-binding protein
MPHTFLVGAVAYDPKVVTIWEGMRDYFHAAGVPTDYVLYSNYDRQVQALLDGHIDIAWATNLAWIKLCTKTQGRCRALAMRDVDRDFTTVFVARADAGVGSLSEVRGKRFALGSADSAQAAILPVHYLRQAGLDAENDYTLVRFDLDVGKHGDTGSSEMEVLRALADNRADAGALASATWEREVGNKCVDEKQIKPFWTSPGYCHCNFCVLPSFSDADADRWTTALLAMKHSDPTWRSIMDMEGVTRWLRAEPAILEGYRVLFDAVDQQGLDGRWT